MIKVGKGQGSVGIYLSNKLTNEVEESGDHFVMAMVNAGDVWCFHDFPKTKLFGSKCTDVT